MYMTTTEKCLSCGGEVPIGMPCAQPCKQYPAITTTISGNTKQIIIKPMPNPRYDNIYYEGVRNLV